MSRFAHVLRRVDREVSIAEPVRSETLLELGADLEGAYQSYRARGLSEQEAVQRAETLLALDAATVSELSTLHAPWYGWMLRDDTRESAVQRALLVGLSVFAIAGGMYAVVASDVLRDPPAGIWLIGVLTAAMAWTAMSGWLHASVGKSTARALLRGLAVLCWAQLVVAALSASYTIAQLGRAGVELDVAVVMSAVGRAAELLTLSVSIALTGFVWWFLLQRQVMKRERLRAELARLLNPEPEALP